MRFNFAKGNCVCVHVATVSLCKCSLQWQLQGIHNKDKWNTLVVRCGVKERERERERDEEEQEEEEEASIGVVASVSC